MICKSCGEFLNEGENFCPNCGTRVEDDVQTSFEEEVVSREEDYFKREDTSNNSEDLTASSVDTNNDSQQTFEEGYSAYSKDSGKTIDSSWYYNLGESFNNLMDPIIRTFVNMNNGFWVLLLLIAIINSLGAFFGGALVGGIFGRGIGGGIVLFTLIFAFAGAGIVYFVQKVIINYVSKSIGFAYGISDSHEEERNILILLGVAVSSIATTILNAIRIGTIPLLGWVIVGLVQTFIKASMFYKYFTGDEFKRFSIKYVVVNIIIAIVVGIFSALFLLMVFGSISSLIY
ncbi:MAG: zinc ribbon domain-containing protein [Tissierellia bacterium]|nr:zinc ribbon domain-containing protein [Tissierellia bacterium]